MMRKWLMFTAIIAVATSMASAAPVVRGFISVEPQAIVEQGKVDWLNSHNFIALSRSSRGDQVDYVRRGNFDREIVIVNGVMHVRKCNNPVYMLSVEIDQAVPTGPQGPVGPQGPAGSQGPPGPPGPPGPVQSCPVPGTGQPVAYAVPGILTAPVQPMFAVVQTPRISGWDRAIGLVGAVIPFFAARELRPTVITITGGNATGGAGGAGGAGGSGYGYGAAAAASSSSSASTAPNAAASAGNGSSAGASPN